MDIESRCPATEQELATLDAYWRAANYLSACQLYLLDDPLLQKPLTEESIKKKIVGHWAPCPVRTLSTLTSTELSKNMT